MTEIQNRANAENKSGKKKETFKGKIIRWSITLVLCVAVFKFITGLQAEQKKEFFAQSRAQATADCGKDRDCRVKIAKYFDQCIKDNYTTYKSGRYNRKYVFDLEGFRACVSSKE